MTFSTPQLPPPILKAIHELGYTTPTAIQQKAIPLIIAGSDIIGQSQTGSGKTAAFGLPILSTISHGSGVRALILTPTRELCIQVTEALSGFAKYLPLRIVPVYGGVGIGHQIAAANKADVVVATPGRLLDVMNRGLKLNTVHYVVLDEADRMLDMGFIDDVEKILRSTPQQRHTLLFTATLSPRLKSLVHRYMRNPATIQTRMHVDTSLLNERAYNVRQDDKLSLLVHLIKKETPGIAVVFCATRHGCDKVARRLRSQRIDATPIHGGLTQAKRTRTIEELHARGIGVLVATDVASRGLHIDNVSHVYNYDVPNTSDDYTHRVGRTARAGAKGDAITFVTPQEARDFNNIMREIRREIKAAPLPAFEKIIPPPSQHEGRQQHGRQKRHGGQKNERPFWKKFKRGRR
jgi:ATP-dependent RNA helicase DeaD